MANTKTNLINERSLISWLLPKLSKLTSKTCRIGPGDDAAILKKPSNLVLSIDSYTDGVHFKTAWAKTLKKKFGLSLGEQIAQKAMRCSLSDLAAMGDVRDRWTMVTLGFPKKTKPQFLKDFHKGIQKAAARFQAPVVGGDTIRSRVLTATVAVGGSLHGKPLQRNKAHDNDYLCVSGLVGDASVGLSLLKSNSNSSRSKGAAYFVGKFFKPDPLFLEGKILAQTKGVTSALDLSDSLHESIELLLPRGFGVDVNLESIPISNPYHQYKKRNISLLSQGEDYSLLFTVKPNAVKVLRRKLRFFILGQVKRKKVGVRYFRKGKMIKTPKVFRHF